MNILEQLAQYAQYRTEQAKKAVPLADARRMALREKAKLEPFAFEKALEKKGLSFICECKKASPSKGIISPDFPYLGIAKEYEKAGADCVSVLTEPKWFLGDDRYLKEIADSISIPCLRKDFTVDSYMIYQAKLLGASAVLLICSILSEKQLEEYLYAAGELGLSVLVEAHDEKEIEQAVKTGARIIGVNNRCLKDFSVDTDNSRKLRELVPENILFISESGVTTRRDIEELTDCGADGVLIGEALMRAPDIGAKFKELKYGYDKD